MGEGWEKWEDERPDWYDDLWVARVPAEMIPNNKAGGAKASEKKESERGRGTETNRDDGNGGGRRKSFVEKILDLQKNGPKIAPAGNVKSNEEDDFDEEDWKREMKKRSFRI